MECSVARRMARCRDGADAWNEFGVALVLFQFVLQEWEHRLKSFGQAMLPFRELGEDALIHPELKLGTWHVNHGVRESRRVVWSLAHKPENMVRMEMRNDHLRDPFRLDTGCRHIGDHRSGCRLKLTARAGVEENRFVAELDQSDVERNRHDFICDPSGSECDLGFLNGHVLDKSGIVRLLPNAIIQDQPLDRTELERPKALAGLRSLLRECCLDEREGLG